MGTQCGGVDSSVQVCSRCSLMTAVLHSADKKDTVSALRWFAVQLRSQMYLKTTVCVKRKDTSEYIRIAA